jgi:lycopene cyclase CruA
MKDLLYLEAPTPDRDRVIHWLQDWAKAWCPVGLALRITPDGVCLGKGPDELSLFTWGLQRTTYLKVFRWGAALAEESKALRELKAALQAAFPPNYPAPPSIDLSTQTIFEALAPHYPQTAKYFQRIPNGEFDLTRVYWWEQRWREGVRNPGQPTQVVFEVGAENAENRNENGAEPQPTYDLIYLGGALGVIQAAVMAQRGYRVLLIERLPFGKMNREWNISREEFQSLIRLGLFTPEEFESVIAREMVDGFHKFFDANNPDKAKAPVLHTPTVLNISIDAEKLLGICGDKFRSAGGEIWDQTEFRRSDISPSSVVVSAVHLPSGAPRVAVGRLLVDAMGTASPIAWQLNGGRPYDSVCPTVGAVFEGMDPDVWDTQYGDVLYSHGDISRGRQLIWELFPARDEEITVYLFHYHQVNVDNPGSLLEMYEDFFSILPEYRRCDPDRLTWKKATFGYIPGYFSTSASDRAVAFDRLVAMGDAASLQSPLIFTGFGSLVRNLPRLTDLLDTALTHDLLSARHLNQVRAYQSNVSVTWMFSKGMMVPTGRMLIPERVNTMLNTFFGILESQPPAIGKAFMQDRADWISFNRMALRTARTTPELLLWIWDMAGAADMIRWAGNYVNFTIVSLIGFLLSWLPGVLRRSQVWLEPQFPEIWFRLLVLSYALTDGIGRPQWREGMDVGPIVIPEKPLVNV